MKVSLEKRFRPLSWGLSFNALNAKMDTIMAALVFVPFLGDFLSIGIAPFIYGGRGVCFRPLSWGLSFN